MAVAAASWSQPTEVCQAEFDALAEAVITLMRSDEDEHEVLLRELRRLKGRHAKGPDACRSSILREEATLVNFLSDYPEAVRLSDAYLASRLADAFPADRAFVLMVRGYARESLGETVAGAQDYFEAASLARQVPPIDGLQSLLYAVETAIEVGDLNAAARYQSLAEGIVLDSLAGNPALETRRGRLLGGQAELLVRQVHAEPDPALRRRRAAALQSIADSAATVLLAERPFSRDVRIDAAREALALSARALASLLLGDRSDLHATLRAAEQRLAFSGGFSRDAGHTFWMRASEIYALTGDARAARHAAEKARGEGRRVEMVRHEAAALEVLAALAEDAGELPEAEALYREALALREVERERMELQDWSVTTFTASQAPYRGLARLLARQGQAAEAFTILDQSRARHLRDLRTQLRLRERLEPSQRLRVDSLLTAIEEARLTQLRDPSGSTRDAQALQISRLQAALYAETELLVKDDETLDLPALQRTLAEQNRTLVSYFFGPRSGLAFVITPTAVFARTLPVTQAAVEQLIREAAGPLSTKPDPAVALGPLFALHEALIRPLADILPPGDGLVIIPDGPLADVPFGMLLEVPAESFSDARFLIRSRAVSTELAAALILEDPIAPARADETPRVDLTAFGRSRFGTEAGAPRSRTGDVLSDLPFVTREIHRVARHARRREVALNSDATEPALRRALQHSRIVHIASHAEADPVFPMYSRIYLWPDGDHDGVLHLYEVQGQHIPAELVVLSGCSTADGQAQRGEGTLGLHYGLRAAGARATLATLWPVDDRATAFLTSAFYNGLAQGLPKDRALQQAQVAYLDAHDGVEASPFFWAAPILSGSPAPVHLDPPTSPAQAALASLLGVLSLLGGTLAWRVRRRRARA